MPPGERKASGEHVGIRQVERLKRYVFDGRGDAEPAAAAVIEDSGKHTGRVKVRQAKPV
jgi:hypothetical protein